MVKNFNNFTPPPEDGDYEPPYVPFDATEKAFPLDPIEQAEQGLDPDQLEEISDTFQDINAEYDAGQEMFPLDNAEQTVQAASTRIESMADEGSVALENFKDKYGEVLSDTKEAVKAKLRGLGSAAARAAKKAGLVTIGAGVLGMRAAKNAPEAMAAKSQERTAARQAEVASARERLAANEQRQADAEAAELARQKEALAEQERLKAEAIAAQEAYDNDYEAGSESFESGVEIGRDDSFNREYDPSAEGGYSDGWEATRQALLDRAHEEALAENQEFDFQKTSREYAEYRLYQAQKRAEFRQRMYDKALHAQDTMLDTYDASKEKASDAYDAAKTKATDTYETAKTKIGDTYETAKERTSETYKKAKGRVKRTGRSIAQFAQRTKNAARAARSAAKTSWQETAA